VQQIFATSAYGTFETYQLPLGMSALQERPEVSVDRAFVTTRDPPLYRVGRSELVEVICQGFGDLPVGLFSVVVGAAGKVPCRLAMLRLQSRDLSLLAPTGPTSTV
jgi:hypothetical protein